MKTNRQRLIDMATGTRTGYWIEILHTADGVKCYALHRPIKDDKPEAVENWAKLCRAYPYTWEALQIMAAKYLGQEDAAGTLEQYDDGNTAPREPMDAHQAAAFAKWIKV